MSNANDEDIKERYNKFLRYLYQYTTTPIKDFLSIKPQILYILKAHRPIKTDDYEYGVSKAGKKKRQLIVHECNQRTMVREYFKVGKTIWQCCECNRIGAAMSHLLIAHGIVFVKIVHECKPRQYSFIMEIQELYKDGKDDEAVALQESILGSEDGPLYQKRGTKTSFRTRKEIIVEILLQCVARRKESAQELQPSIMDEQLNKNQKIRPPLAVLVEIIMHLKEYSNETVDQVLTKTSMILRVLKTHRPMKMVDYIYGFSSIFQPNHRLIVFEFNDRKQVREYSYKKRITHLWECRECCLLCKHQKNGYKYAFLHLINGIVFVPFHHRCECKARDYDLVSIYQKFLENGDRARSYFMARYIGFSYGKKMLKYYKPGFDGSLCLSERQDASDNESNSKTTAILKRKMQSESDDKSPVHKRSNHTVAETHSEVEEDESVSIVSTSVFLFEKPTPTMLEKICTKFNIQYRNKVMNIWDQIMFKQIDTMSFASANIQTHEYEIGNFYSVLSQLFSGKLKHHQQIKEVILEAFRTQVVESGEMTSKKFNKHYWNDTVTDEHLSFLAKYLQCRILIFDGDECVIKKYGKSRETSRKRVTLVLFFSEGFYSIVLNL